MTVSAKRLAYLRDYRKKNYAKNRRTVTRYRLSLKGTVAHLWKGCKARAQRKGIPFTITKAAIAKKLLLGSCEMTGIKFVRQKTGGRIHPFAPSIDRVDYEKGYTDENFRLVVFSINAARGHWGDDVLKQVCEAFMKHITR